MSSVAVQCPSCSQWARVGSEVLGQIVACPHCPQQFPAEPVTPTRESIPVVHPRQPKLGEIAPRPPVPSPVFDPHDDILHPHAHHLPTGTGLLWGLALLPVGVPLLWLAVAALARKPEVFSFAAPVALAFCFSGICVGIALISRWSVIARIRMMAFVVAIAYLSSVVLFVAQPRWIEWLNRIPRFVTGNVEYRSPDRMYSIRYPGTPEPMEKSPLPDWPLKAVRYFDIKEGVTFISAHGGKPLHMPVAWKDEKRFEAAELSILQESGGSILNRQPVTSADYTARDLEIQMPEDRVKRFVRVVLHEEVVYYLSVEGMFLTADTPKVKDFMRSFRVIRRK